MSKTAVVEDEIVDDNTEPVNDFEAGVLACLGFISHAVGASGCNIQVEQALVALQKKARGLRLKARRRSAAP